VPAASENLRLTLIFTLPVVLPVLLSASCAASFDGEIDNRTVPTFASAAFGYAEPRGQDFEYVAVGMMLPGDSCTDGAE
jgi:hypothetical protein